MSITSRKNLLNKHTGNRHFRRKEEAQARRANKYVLETIKYRLRDPEVIKKYNLTEEMIQELERRFGFR